MASKRCVLVTGGNTGIGKALCQQLVSEHECHVFLGSRDLTRGKEAVESIISTLPAEKKSDLELIQCDVGTEDSVKAAAATIKGKLNGALLFAIVNNAGIGFGNRPSDDKTTVNVNLYGAKRITDNFLPLLDATSGRIVNVGSGSGPRFVSKLQKAGSSVEKALTSWDTPWSTLEDLCTRFLEGGEAEDFGDHEAYGFSKACLTIYTMQLSKQFPTDGGIKVSCVSPGFIDTNMTKGYGASKLPEEGTESIRHCLFQPLIGENGFYYGSDALRSPLHYMRNPGEPAYTGE